MEERSSEVAAQAAAAAPADPGSREAPAAPGGGSPDARGRAALLLLSLMFTTSGAVGLLAEQCFERLLSTLVGSSTEAAAIVLAVYFGGLTLGGYGYGRFLRPRVQSGLRSYALLEALVGGWTLFLFLSFDVLSAAFTPLLSLGLGHPALLALLRLLVSLCWILPATLPMGASFPAMVDALDQLFQTQAGMTKDSDQRGRVMARFYSLNLLGAILGAALSPFLLFPYLGLSGTLLCGGLLDLLVALGALRLWERAPAPAQVLTADVNTSGERPRLALLLTATLSGALLFSLEVLWTHLHAAVLGVSVYAFAAVLTLVLLGLLLSGALITSLFPGRRSLPRAVPAAGLLVGALLLLVQQRLWPEVPRWLFTYGRQIYSFSLAQVLLWGVGALMLIPPATALGVIYPSLFRLSDFPQEERGRAAGLLGAWNAVGCVFGALLTSHLLIPHLGSERTLAGLAVLCAAGGLVLLWPAPRGRLLGAAGAVLVLAVALWLPRWDLLDLTAGGHTYFRLSHVLRDSKLAFFHESTTGGMTTVVQNPHKPLRLLRPGEQASYLNVLLSNGKFQGNDAGEVEAQRAFALLPSLFMPRFQDALVIGLGSGQSAHIVHTMGYEQVHIADISPGVVEAARRHFRHINGAVLEQPNVHLSLQDGRNLLLLDPRLYDLISMELTSVWWAGATNLYSREFYELLRKRLRPGGVVQQWIQLHHIGTEELLSVISTLRSVFPVVTLWVVGGQGILLATEGPQVLRGAALHRVQARRQALGWASDAEMQRQVAQIVAQRLLAPEEVAQIFLSGEFVINSDRNRYIEYATPRFNYDRTEWEKVNLVRMAALAKFPRLAVEPGGSGPLWELVQRFNEGDDLRPQRARAALGLSRPPPPGAR